MSEKEPCVGGHTHEDLGLVECFHDFDLRLKKCVDCGAESDEQAECEHQDILLTKDEWALAEADIVDKGIGGGL